MCGRVLQINRRRKPRGLVSPLSVSCPSLTGIGSGPGNNYDVDWLNSTILGEWDSPTPPNATAHYWGES